MRSYPVEITRGLLYDEVDLPVKTADQYANVDLFYHTHGSLPSDIQVTPEGWFARWHRTNVFDKPKDDYDGVKLTSGQEFLGTRLNALFIEDGCVVPLIDQRKPTNQSSLYMRSAIQFLINNKVYWQSPIWQAASPYALFATPTDILPHMKELYGIDWKRVGASLELDDKKSYVSPDGLGVVISYLEHFNVKVQVSGEIAEKTSLAIYLDGSILRPVI
jgi:hypothetical protein